jgi:outer membrane lipoprotein-sorting protein
MTDQERKLVSQIEATAAEVASFIAEYELTMNHAGISLHSRGKLYYADQSRYRVEGITNGQRIITVSNNEVSQTFFVDQRIVSQSNSMENQSPIDLLHGLSDIRDSFSSTDKETLVYVGKAHIDEQKVHHFKGHFPILPIQGNIRVRMPIEVDLFIDRANCLLLRRIWTQTGKGTLVNANYRIMEINGTIDDSYFSIDVSSPDIRKVDTMDITNTLFFSDEKNTGASMN